MVVNISFFLGCFLVVLLLLNFNFLFANTNPHTTYLWHLHQPIYWPDQKSSGDDQYENAWDSIQATDGGRPNPENNLREIFGKDDRVAVYQYRPRDSINTIISHSDAGAQVNYSGALIENVMSLANAGQLGYYSGWQNSFIEARNWQTSSGFPKMDIVNFTYHHCIAPLVSDETLEMEIKLHQEMMSRTWGTNPALSNGFFPAEMCFSERIIPVLKDCGIEWTIVANNHISRICEDFPLVIGTGGEACDLPNEADIINPTQTNYFRLTISRGVSPTNAVPYAYRPHYAKYVDPETGVEDKIIVVPSAQAFSWLDGYQSFSPSEMSEVTALNDPSHPELIVLTHDGDNAFGGGYSYYMECVQNFVNEAASLGQSPSTIQQYLNDHPVDVSDIIHIEDGGWVNADCDFGSPIFINWNYVLYNQYGDIDIENGWDLDERNWAVITAAENRVKTAQQISGATPRIDKILDPDSSTTDVERAWHYYLGSLDSGYMYYGSALDLESKTAIACNEAVEHSDSVIGDGLQDSTPPTIWALQRHPYNPGSLNYGVQYGWVQYNSNGDFWVWTFIYDVSGVQSVNFKYRIDNDGVNPLSSNQNETFADGSEVGQWQTLSMTKRVFPANNVYNDPDIDFFEMPQYIADQYWVKVTGLNSVLIDYYVEATDNKGSTSKSPIYHTYIGDGSGSGGGDRVTIEPSSPVAGQQVKVIYDDSQGPIAGSDPIYIHLGYDNFSTIISPDPVMTHNSQTDKWEYTTIIPSSAWEIDFVFRNDYDQWDNNDGQDWKFAVSGAQTSPYTMDGSLDGSASLLDSNGLTLYAANSGDYFYVATTDAGEGNDHFIFVALNPGSLLGAPWAKSGSVAQWNVFVADEDSNTFSGWFDSGGNYGISGFSESATGSNGGVLEGVISLSEVLGTVPSYLYLSASAYQTNDGGSLIFSTQSPPSQNSDGNVDANEYIKYNLSTFTDYWAFY